MTVSTGTNFKSYAGNGSTTTFAYTFKIFQDTNLVVTLVNDTTGAETTQSLTTNYTVTGVGSDSGGNVVFGTAPPSGNTAVIRRVLPITQETNYVPNDPFPAEAHEDALDKLTMLVQQEATSNDLAISFPEGDVGSGLENTLPSAADRAGQIISFDTSGNVSTTNIANVPSIGTVSLTVSGVASFADGSASAPSITNIGDTNTGMYFGAADQINFSVSGSEVISVASTGTTISGLSISSGDILLTDNSATALEIKEGSNNYLTFNTTNGSEKISFGSTANPTFEVNGSFRQPLIAATTSFFSQTYSGATLSATNGAVNIESYSASKAGIVLNGSGDQITFTSPTLGFVGLVQVVGAITTNTSLNIASSTTVTGILDEDDMSSNSDTKLATQQSIKAYVDAQVGTVDTLAEVLGNGNTTGGTNIVVSANDVISLDDGTNALPSLTTTGDLNTGIYFPAADEVGITTGGTQRVKVDSTGVNVTGTVTVGTLIDTPDIETSTVSARDGTTSFSIANSSGTATFDNSLTISRNSGTGVLPTLDIICTDTTAIQNQTLGALDFQTSDTNEAGTLASIQARKTNSTSASTNLAALELYTGRPGDLIKAVTINADQTTSFAAAIDVTGTVTATGTSVFASLDISGDIDVDGTTNLDVVDIDGAVDMASTLTVGGNISLTGATTISNTSGDLTLDAAGNITLDTDGGTISLKDGGIEFGFLDHGSNDKLSIKSTIQDADIGFFGNDGGGEITALTLDMSEAGAATFNSDVTTGGKLTVSDAGNATVAAIRFNAGLGLSSPSTDQLNFITADATRMTIDSSGNTTFKTSAGQLSVEALGGGSVKLNSNGSLGMNVASGFSYEIDVGGGEVMRIDSSGNVGIGVSPETWNGLTALQINSQASVSADGSSIQLSANSYYNSAWKYINTAVATNYYQDSGTHVWRYAASGSADAAITWSEAMRIDSSGNLLVGTTNSTPGIGDTDDGAVLGAAGWGFFSKTYSSADSSSVLYVGRNGTDGNIINIAKDGSTVGSIASRAGVVTSLILDPRSGGGGLTGGGAALYPTDNAGAPSDGTLTLGDASSRFKDLYLSGGVKLPNCTLEDQVIKSNTFIFENGAGTTEYGRFDSSGNLLVGTTSTSYGSKLTVLKNGGSSDAMLGCANTATSGTRRQIDFFDGSSNTRKGSIETDGSNTSFNTSSDYRLKENVTYTWDATTRLKQLKPARFDWIGNSEAGTQDGFLAHEVSSVVPFAVSGEKDAVDENGNINPQSIDHSKLVSLLVKTIQELEARITALENA